MSELININQIDKNVIQVVDVAVQSFLKSNISFIKSVHKQIDERRINYCIELIEDNTVNRDNIFRFLDYFEGTKLSNQFEVNFHFIPSDLVASLTEVQSVSLA